jgi:N-acetylglucosaminyldiphosphoundecaprenol N-acetyl-beta-D-mannosaminyltransferase
LITNGIANDHRVNILGVGVSAITLDDAVGHVERWIDARIHNYICVTGAHGVLESRRDKCLCDIHKHAGLVTPDGMPVVWLSRLLGEPHIEQVCGRDLMRALTALSTRRGYRQVYYGGGVGVAEQLKKTLTAAYPGLAVVGTFCPPFRELTAEEDATTVEAINALRPDIVWIGLSTPKQERWMASHRDRIEAPVIVGVGAAFDFLAGKKPVPPRWIQRCGLEWSFRLCTEPRRLWRRYAYIVPGFALLAAADLIRRILWSAAYMPRSVRPPEQSS